MCCLLLHRGLVTRAMELAGVGQETELRHDKAVPRSPLFYRVYLDNFDTLQKVNPSAAALLEGRPNGASLALRSVYEEFNVPQNVKKTVEQQLVAEMQGALFDGVEGSIRAKDEKTARYVQGGLFLLRSKSTSLNCRWGVGLPF